MFALAFFVQGMIRAFIPTQQPLLVTYGDDDGTDSEGGNQ